MSTLTIDKPATLTITESALTLRPPCDAMLEAKYPCGGEATVIVRFKAHGCVRDGHGILLCHECRDWIAGNPVGCAACHMSPPEGELFIVSSVAL